MVDFAPPRPRWFVVAAVILLLWGAMGCFACIQQIRLGADSMPGATEYDRALLASLPGWYNAVYAVAVGAGFAGALALLMRSRVAVALFAVSLAAVIVQFGYLFATTDIIAVKGAGTAIFPVFIAIVGVVALLLARRAQANGWIR